MKDSLTLMLKLDGSLELTDNEGETLWCSDTDEDFHLEFDDVITEDEMDAASDWLEDNDFLDDRPVFFEFEGAEDEDEDDD